MKKHIYWMVAIAIVLASSLTGCRKNDDKPDDNLLDLPYSQLTPAQQRAKLEQESINFLNEIRGLSNSSAIKAMQNLAELLDRSTPDIPEPIREVSDWKEIFDLTDVVGIFTWNNSQERWIQSNSPNNDLRFIFPATKGGTTGNATLIVTVRNSGLTVTETWCSWDEWDHQTQSWVCVQERERVYNLPNSATAILNIDNREAARITYGAEFVGGNEIPRTVTYRMTTNDGYELFWLADRGKEEVALMRVTRNDNNLLEARGTTASKLNEISDLLINGDFTEDDILNRLAQANATVRLMSDLVLVYAIEDPAGFYRAMDAINEWSRAESERIRSWHNAEAERIREEIQRIWDNWTSGDWDELLALLDPWYREEDALWRTRDSLDVLRWNEVTRRQADAMNNFMRCALVSTKDNFRVADLVARAEKRWTWQGFDEYGIVFYLRFRDNVLIEAETYFGEGFDRLISEWEDFLNAFNR